jgi:peptidoglycan hydrolase-like protein with peptidoglycan-binding domain
MSGRGNRNRRRTRVGLTAVAIGACGLVGGSVLTSADPGATAPEVEEADGATTATATVERRDLVERVDESGTLGYADASSVRGHRTGVLTTAVEPGTVLDRGQAGYTIDGRPVPLFFGPLPMWRRLEVGAEGADVAQLEANLVALGFASEAQTRNDGEYDARTAAAVKRWQEALGVEETGVVELGDVEYVAGPVRVVDAVFEIGEQVGPGAVVLEVSATERVVTVDLDAERQGLVAEGDAVQVELADGSVVPGTIRDVGTVATADESQGPGTGTPTITLTIVLDDPASGGTLDESPVVVKFTRDTAAGVLAVPVRALLALAEGGYAVEVVRPEGNLLVAVELGSFADGYVEIIGDVAEGDTVVTAS